MKDTASMIVAALLFVALGFGAYWWWNKDAEPLAPYPDGGSTIATTTPPTGTEVGGPASIDVTFNASDGYKLSGTFSVPAVNSPIKVPVIVLVHQFGTNRHDFDVLVPRLLDEGYAVLAYDSRGSGTSMNGAADKKDYMKDFSGALTFLNSRTEVDPSSVGVVGASIGGNVAFVASGSFPNVKVAVALSPASTGMPKELLGTTVSGFSPQAVFVASDSKDKAEADLIFKKIAEPKQQKVYQDAGHGAKILLNDAAAQDVLSFITQFLDIKG